MAAVGTVDFQSDRKHRHLAGLLPFSSGEAGRPPKGKAGPDWPLQASWAHTLRHPMLLNISEVNVPISWGSSGCQVHLSAAAGI